MRFSANGAARLIKPIVPAAAWERLRDAASNARYAVRWRRRTVSELTHKGEIFRLAVVDPGDFIQPKHAAGRLYEENELAAIASHFPVGGVFIDVGANTGQHGIYMLKVGRAARAIFFEPNPPAVRLLRENIRLNNLLDRSDLSHLGIGLGDKAAHASVRSTSLTNLGGASLAPSARGRIPIARGDDLLGKEPRIDFIKIDTEGFEMKVLAGLSQTIRRHRPTMFIEVDERNAADFGGFLSSQGYEVTHAERAGPVENVIAEPSITR